MSVKSVSWQQLSNCIRSLSSQDNCVEFFSWFLANEMVISHLPSHLHCLSAGDAAEGEQKAPRVLREAAAVIAESPSALQVS